jgi:putative CocE/NonD family hydrolase
VSGGICLALLLSLPIALSAATDPTPDQLQALAGLYTDPVEPDSPLSFYVENGKLIEESDRRVPVEMTPLSPTEFVKPDSKAKFVFTLDDAGRGKSLNMPSMTDHTYQKIGDPVHHVFHDYQRTEAMIPMRDGVKLHAVILKPTDIAAPLPILMQRTPYGVDSTNSAWFFATRPELARDGYIYVGEDIRGRYKSDGQFLMSRPLLEAQDGRKKKKAVDESTDAYDTIDWLVKNVAGNNGRVGVLGTSYPGFLSTVAGVNPHPALKAISPQAPMIDVWMGDDFFHNGAFRQSYGYDYVIGMESNKETAEVSYGKDQDGKARDGYDYFLERGNFAQDAKHSGSRILPTWKLFLDHPAYDQVWSSRGVEHHLGSVTVPTLSVGGYYDQEDMWGPQEEYAKLEPEDTTHENFLVLGPWRHGSWALSSRHLGDLAYGESIGDEFRSQIEAKFFGHYLKDAQGFELADTASFQTGSNTWKYYAHFPPKEAKSSSLYLKGAGAMSWDKPAEAAKTSYESDPANPVPYRHRPIQPTYGDGSQWYYWLTEDQRFVTNRKDLALWKLPALTKDVTVTGDVLADIFAATTGTDNDLVVKLIDQYPDDDPDPKMRGYQLMTNAEIFRGRYLTGFDKPEALSPGSVREYKFSLHAVDHMFKAGHSILVEVQSTWFPLYDRNPQTFVPNIMKARPGDYRKATITVYEDPEHPSHLDLPMM